MTKIKFKLAKREKDRRERVVVSVWEPGRKANAPSWSNRLFILRRHNSRNSRSMGQRGTAGGRGPAKQAETPDARSIHYVFTIQLYYIGSRRQGRMAERVREQRDMSV